MRDILHAAHVPPGDDDDVGIIRPMPSHDVPDRLRVTPALRAVASVGLGVCFCVGSGSMTARQATSPNALVPTDVMVAKFLAAADVYERTFRDLVAQETKTVEEFDDRGTRTRGRQIVSDFILYSSSRTDATAEYRDVLSVDGEIVKTRERRAIELLTAAAAESSVEKELERINNESTRYEFGMHWVGFTTNQASWIKTWRDLFQFESLGEESIDGHTVVVLRYQQTTSRPGSFGIRLPGAFVPRSMLIRGKLWLDAATGQLWRSEEEFTVRHRTRGTAFVWARIDKDYVASDFGIGVPRRIVLNQYSHYREPKNGPPVLALSSRTTLSYEGFRRFGVTSESEYQMPTPSR